MTDFVEEANELGFKNLHDYIVYLIKNTKKGNTEKVRISSINKLGQIGDRIAVIQLVDIMKEGNKDITESVLLALGLIGEDIAIHAINELLTTERSKIINRIKEIIDKVVRENCLESYLYQKRIWNIISAETDGTLFIPNSGENMVNNEAEIEADTLYNEISRYFWSNDSIDICRSAIYAIKEIGNRNEVRIFYEDLDRDISTLINDCYHQLGVSDRCAYLLVEINAMSRKLKEEDYNNFYSNDKS